MDQYYYEEGYIDSGYHVYIGNAVIDLRPYIEDNYIDPSYYEYYGITTTLTGELSLVTGELEEASASLSSAFTQSAVAIKTVDAVSTQTSSFTQTVTATRIMQIEAAFTDAFAPVMTVNAIRNSFAVLDAQASLSVDAVANRAANVTLESIVNQSLSGDRFRDYASAQTVTATQSTSASKSVVASSTQSSAFTLTANVGEIQLFNAQLASEFKFLPSKYIGTGRPRNLTGGAFTTNSKFGTHALRGDTTWSSPSYATTRPKVDQNWAVEWWQYNDYITSGLNGSNISFGWFRGGNGGTDGQRPNLTITDANNTAVINFTGSPILNLDDWNHFLVVKDSSRLSYFVNGTRVYTTTTLPTSYYSSNTNSFKASDFPSRGDNRLDEISIWHNTNLGYSPSSTTITVPTLGRTNDENTIALWHMDNNIFDDVSAINISGGANLSSISTITALTTIAYNVTIGFSSTSNLSTVVNVFKTTSSTQSSEFTQSTDIQRIRSGASTQLAEFTQTASADVTRTTDVTLTSAFAQSATATRIQQGTSNFNAVASQLTAAAKIGDFLIACDVVASQTAVAVKTTDVVSTQSSAFTQTADGIKAVEVSATVVTEFAQTTSVRRLAGLTSNQNSAFTQSSNVNYTAENSSNQTATSLLSADAAGSTVGFASAMSAEFIQSAAFDRFRNTSSNQNSEFTQSTNTANSYIRGFDSALSSNADVAVSGLRIKQGSANFDAVASQLTAAAKIGDFLVAADVISTLNANINVTATGVSTQTAEFAQITNGVKNAVSSAQVNSEFTQVTAAIKAVNATGAFNSEFTLTATPVKATDAISLEVGAFTQTTAAVKTASGASNFESIAFELSAGSRIRNVSAGIVTTASVSAVAGKRVNASSTINSAMTFVVGFKVIHITAELTYKIPRENRTYKIQRENREYTIREEDRTFKIKRG